MPGRLWAYDAADTNGSVSYCVGRVWGYERMVCVGHGVGLPISLRACCAMSGTYVADHDADSVCCYICLRACYAMSGTDLAAERMVAEVRHALRGTISAPTTTAAATTTDYRPTSLLRHGLY
eukprot:3198319-Rhodomonas_salina.2